MQIIAEHEAKGESVLPINLLTDLVRSYTSQAGSSVPQFLSASFEMFRKSQSQWLEQMNGVNPMIAQVPGFEALQAQQEAFMKAMAGGGFPGGKTAANWSAPAREDETDTAEDLSSIKEQLAELQEKLSKLDK